MQPKHSSMPPIAELDDDGSRMFAADADLKIGPRAAFPLSHLNQLAYAFLDRWRPMGPAVKILHILVLF